MIEEFDLTPGPAGVVLIASQASAIRLIESLRINGYQGGIVVVEDTERPLPEVAAEFSCERVSISAGNVPALLPRIDVQQPPLGCVVGWHRVFPRAVVDAFRGRLLNVHCGDLPEYRGAGGGSWQVLNGAERVVAHLQQMQVAIDRGPVLRGETALLPAKPFPADVKAAGRSATEQLLCWLGQAISRGQIVPLQPQDEQRATYFPRLDHRIHAWIDLSWPVAALERFVRAFGNPYPGAMFRYADSRFRVRRAWIRSDHVCFHPFCIGLIVNRDEDAIHVAACDGVLCLAEIRDESGLPIPVGEFRVGERIWCDPVDLARARQVRALAAAPGLQEP